MADKPKTKEEYMPDKVKSSVLVLILLVIVSVALAGGFFVMLQKEKAKGTALTEELEDIKTRLKITETKLDDAKKMTTDLGAKLQQAEAQISDLNTQLQQEKASKDQALAKIEELRVDLEQQKGLRADLEKKFDQAQSDAKRMQAQLKDLDAKKGELEAKVKDLEAKAGGSAGVELGKIVVSPEVTPAAAKAAAPLKPAKPQPQKPPAVPSGMEGKVLVINKDYSFAVINLGSKDGVGVGDVFAVYHNDKYTGDVKVEKVHDSMAAAGFVSADIKDKVFEGDKAVRKSK
jgi:flagellar basal body-associated protein FliL